MSTHLCSLSGEWWTLPFFFKFLHNIQQNEQYSARTLWSFVKVKTREVINSSTSDTWTLHSLPIIFFSAYEARCSRRGQLMHRLSVFLWHCRLCLHLSFIINCSSGSSSSSSLKITTESTKIGALAYKDWREAWQPSPNITGSSQRRSWKSPGEPGVNQSVECDIFPSILWHCWLGNRKGTGL